MTTHRADTEDENKERAARAARTVLDAQPSPGEQMEALAKTGGSVSAAWVLAHLDEIVGDRFDLPRLALSPLAPEDEYLSREADEIARKKAREQALKPAPGAKPVRNGSKDITVT